MNTVLKKRFRDGCWCKKCNKETNDSTCPDCGSRWADGYHNMEAFAVIEEHKILVKRAWYNPSTWLGYKWIVKGLK